jgi:large subunit ribosomal protein L24
MKIHKGDTVKVLHGKDAGVTGKVLAVDHDADKVTVEGVNRVYKHVRPSQKNPQGGRLQKEMPLQASNVMVVCPGTGKPTRVGFRYLPDGSKERFARKSGVSLGMVAPAKKQYAKKA